MQYGDFVKGALTVVDSTFTANDAVQEGGALSIGWFGVDAVDISGTTFDGNDAGMYGGAVSFM